MKAEKVIIHAKVPCGFYGRMRLQLGGLQVSICFEAVHPQREKCGSFKEADQREVADTSKEFLSRPPASDSEVTVNPDESPLRH